MGQGETSEGFHEPQLCNPALSQANPVEENFKKRGINSSRIKLATGRELTSTQVGKVGHRLWATWKVSGRELELPLGLPLPPSETQGSSQQGLLSRRV